MTHFMRQDSDKMLSDMADGSGYNKSEESEEYDDYSGSGDGIPGNSAILRFSFKFCMIMVRNI